MMNVIRGAITIDEDTPKQIREKTELLLHTIKEQNGLTEENTKAIVFSLTQDIHSYYPAVGAAAEPSVLLYTVLYLAWFSSFSLI